MTEAALLDQIEQLKEVIGIDRSLTSRLQSVFGLEPKQAELLGYIYRREYAYRRGAYIVLWGHEPECDWPNEKELDHLMCKLRERMENGGHHIVIDTRRGEGWSMKRGEKAKIKAQLDIGERRIVSLADRRRKFLEGP